MKEYLLNRVFEEMKQSNVNVHYATELIDRQVMYSNVFTCLIAFFSGGGVLLSFVEAWIPVATSSLIFIGAVANQFHPVFFLKTADLTRLCSLRTEYWVYFNKLQSLFCLIDSGRMGEIEGQTEFDKLIETNATRQTDIGKLFGNIKRDIEQIAIKKSDKYLNNIYNGNKKDE